MRKIYNVRYLLQIHLFSMVGGGVGGGGDPNSDNALDTSLHQDTTTQDGDRNVLLNCLYQSI